MIGHVWSVLCLRSIIDRRTNNISLIDVIEEVTVQGSVPHEPEGKTPALPLTLTLVSLWGREPEDQPAKGEVRISLLTPNHKELKDLSVHTLDLSEKLRMRMFNNSPFLPFYGPGTYRFRVQVKEEGETEWKEVASVPLNVKVEEVQEAASPETEKNKES